MAYIGRGTESISNVEVLDNLTFNGSASYTLQKSSTNFVPSSANNLLISISGVVQQGNFSVSGSTITFDTTVSASDTCDWILHYGTGLITTVADGAITEAKLGSNAVTTAKINNGAITSAKLDSGLALGKIGQVLSTVTYTQQSTSSTGYTDITDMDLDITLSSTSSKALIMVHVNGAFNNSASTSETCRIRVRAVPTSGSQYNVGVLNNYNLRGNSNNGEGTLSGCFLDAPSSTVTRNYKIQFSSGSGNSVIVNTNNNSNAQLGDNSTNSTLTVMEVLA